MFFSQGEFCRRVIEPDFIPSRGRMTASASIGIHGSGKFLAMDICMTGIAFPVFEMELPRLPGVFWMTHLALNRNVTACKRVTCLIVRCHSK